MTPVTVGTPVNLENLGLGVAKEKFDEEFQKALKNIMDQNTPWKTTRKITLTVSLRPNEDRDSAEAIIDCVSKLAPEKVFPTKIFIGKDIKGNAEAHEVNAAQFNLFPKKEGNVTSMAAAAGREE